MISKMALHGTISKEKDFQQKLLHAYREAGMFVYKLPDTGFDFKPYDMIVTDTDGETYHIELKIVDGESINYKDIRPNQHASLKKISSFRRGIAYIIVYSKALNDYEQIEYVDFIESLNDKGTHKIKLPQ